jgi:cytochrome c biogenesis protein CcmG/thiol:disulfide interchange protein DsbE
MNKLLMTITIVALLWGSAVYINSSDGQDNKNAVDQTEATIEEASRIGFKAPAFELTSFDQKIYSLDTLNGKPVVVNFWASWCGPCRLEAPELTKLYDEYGDKVEIYAINLTDSDSIKGAQDFTREFGFKFPVLLDLKGEVASKYRVKAIPTTYFINKDGIIEDLIIGYANPEVFSEKFGNLVNTD